VNIKTTRPLDAPGTKLNLGVKGCHGHLASNLPSNIEGDSITPEISGIFTTTGENERWGFALTASYQERAAGFNQASVGNGWRPFGAEQAPTWGTIGPTVIPTSRTARVATTSTRCRRTSATASAVSSASAPTARRRSSSAPSTR
jgi:hypothetical protein